MHHNNKIVWLGLALAFGLVRLASAGEGQCQNCQASDGCCFREVISHRCVMVPDKKQIKKTVYECKDVPYCEHRLPKFGHCDCCPECTACPKYKKVLIKREIVITEICTTKCVVEEFVERVPAPCCRCGHLPCGEGTGASSPNSGAPVPPTPPADNNADNKSVWLPPVRLQLGE